jgi:RND superfamily putative drug exporter
MRGIADFCYRRRRLVVVGWFALLIGLTIISAAAAGKYRTEFKLPDSESARALDLLEERGSDTRQGGSGQFVFQYDGQGGVNNPQVKATMEKFFSDVGNVVEGTEIVSPYDPANSFQISKDGKTAYAEINFANREQSQFIKDADAIKELKKEVQVDGLKFELGGDFFADFEQPSGEAFGLIAAAVILFIAFGSLLAMGLPIVTALFGIGCGAAIIGLLTHLLAVPDFTPFLAGMIGLGVGIDYALLIVTRYRSSLHEGRTPRDSVITAIDTSGRAVLFAGITVVISLLGMWMMNLDFMRSLSLGAVSSVLLTMLASITLLPAILGFVGYNIERPKIFGRSKQPRREAPANAVAPAANRFPVSLVKQQPDTPAWRRPTFEEHDTDVTKTFWYKWSRVIQKYPWPALIGSTTLLLILAIPVFSLRLGFGDAGNRQTSDTTRRAYDMLSDAFGPGFNGPFLIVLDTPGGSADLPKAQQLTDAIRKTEGVASASDPILLDAQKLTLINVFATTSPQDEETTQLVHRLRNETIPPVAESTGLTVYASGSGPIIVDFSDFIGERLPWFVGAVLLLSFLLLLAVFHSLIVPVKAVIMNMLSIGAAFGAMIAVFQWGFGASLIGVGREGPIEAWGPMMMFAIVFGLSMDYEVFLLTRVREEYDRNGGNNGAAVADGLAATGRVISAAAAIMVFVFGAFMIGDDRALKMIGFGLAFSIFIDATIVRLILVPSAMELLGKKNWWAPSWLVKLLPTIRVEADAHSAPSPAASGD